MSSSNRPQMTTMNGKRPSTLPPRHHQQSQVPQQSQQNREQNEPSSQHSDLIKYIYESWNSVKNEYHDNNYQYGNSSNHRNSSPVYYQAGEPNPRLKNFEPFDLERLFTQRNAQNVTRNTNSSS